MLHWLFLFRRGIKPRYRYLLMPFAELAVFAEDEIIPVTLITALWQATGGLDRSDTTGPFLLAMKASMMCSTLVCPSRP